MVPILQGQLPTYGWSLLSLLLANSRFAAESKIGLAHVAMSISAADAAWLTNSRCANVTGIIRFRSIRNSGFFGGRAMS